MHQWHLLRFLPGSILCSYHWNIHWQKYHWQFRINFINYKIIEATIGPVSIISIDFDTSIIEVMFILSIASCTEPFYLLKLNIGMCLTYPKAKCAFWVNPLIHAAIASIKLTNPKLAWMGTMALRQPYVAFSQHRHTRNLSKWIRCFNNEHTSFSSAQLLSGSKFGN